MMPHCHAALRARGCMRNLLHILNHYAISCAPLNIKQSLAHLRSSRRTSRADSRRVAPSCSMPAARATSAGTRRARAPASEPLAAKKRLPHMGEPLQIACSYAAPAAGRAGSTDLPSPTPLHPPERGTQRRLSGPTPPSGQRPARLSPGRTPQQWPCPCRSTCSRPDGR